MPADDETASDGIKRVGIAAWSILGVILLAGLALRVLYLVRDMFPPLVLALAIIFILNPLVSWLERHGVRRWMGTLSIYALFAIALVGAGFLMAPAMRNQISDLVDSAPVYVDRASGAVERVAARFGVSLEGADLRSLLERGEEQLRAGLERVAGIAVGAFHLILIFVLAPIFAVYILIDLPRLQKSFVEHLPPAQRDDWLMLLQKAGQAVGSFFRGQLVVAAIVGIMSSIGLLIAGIPFWLPIGLTAGFFNLVPLIGPFIGGALAVVVGAVAGGWSKAFLGALVMLIVQQIDNHLISPNVMGRAVRLHPVTIMVALLAGGTLAGFFGMLLAVPATAVGKILTMHYYYRHVLGAEPGVPEEPRSRPQESKGV